MLVLRDNYGCFESTPKNHAKFAADLSGQNFWKNFWHSFSKSDMVNNAVSILYHMEDPADFLYEQYWENVYEK